MQEPNVSVRTYTLAYLAMLALLLINVAIAFLNLGWASMLIALVIGAMEAAILVFVLMEGLFEKPLIHVVMGGGLFWFLILVTLTMTDYITRNWLPIVGK